MRSQPTAVGYLDGSGSGRTEETVTGTRNQIRFNGWGRPQRGIRRKYSKRRGQYRGRGAARLTADLALDCSAIVVVRTLFRGGIVTTAHCALIVAMFAGRGSLVAMGYRSCFVCVVCSSRAQQPSGAHRCLEWDGEQQREQYGAVEHFHCTRLPDEMRRRPDHAHGCCRMNSRIDSAWGNQRRS